MSMKAAMLVAIAETLGAMTGFPGGKAPYVRRCLVCGEEIGTDKIDPFCGDDCRIKHREKNNANVAHKKEKKQKPWKRK